jgi:uncharacterized protein
VIVPDVNLLLYAYDSGSPFHAKAATWWQACLAGDEPVLLPEVVIFGFIRVSTNARAYHHPMTAAESIAHVRSWLEQAPVQIAVAAPGHCERVLALIAGLGTAGNLVTDAQIAAIALENDAVLHTADADFLRFKGLRWQNHLTGDAPARPRRGR